MLTQTKIELEQPLQERKTKADILVLIPGDGINKKNMIRDLVYGCWCNGRRIGGMQMPPVNHLYTATILKDDGHNVQFIDGQIDYDSFNGLRKEGFKNLDFVFSGGNHTVTQHYLAAAAAAAVSPEGRPSGMGAWGAFRRGGRPGNAGIVMCG